MDEIQPHQINKEKLIKNFLFLQRLATFGLVLASLILLTKVFILFLNFSAVVSFFNECGWIGIVYIYGSPFVYIYLALGCIQYCRIRLYEISCQSLLKPPFYRFNRILGFLFTRKFYERVISEVLADAEIEYYDALEVGHKWQARWSKILGYCFLFIAIFREIFAAIKDVLFGISKITK